MRNKKGLTLVELLVVSSIIVVIGMTVYSSFRTGIATYARLDSSFDAYQSTRIFFRRIETDLRNSFVYSAADSQFEGDGTFMQFFSVVDSFQRDGNWATEVWRIRYDLKDRVLTRLCSKGIDSFIDDGEVAEDEVSENIREVSFEYAGSDSDNPWQKEWPGDKNTKQNSDNIRSLPAAVRITLTIAEKDGRGSDVKSLQFKRIIYLPASDKAPAFLGVR